MKICYQRFSFLLKEPQGVVAGIFWCLFVLLACAQTCVFITVVTHLNSCHPLVPAAFTPPSTRFSCAVGLFKSKVKGRTRINNPLIKGNITEFLMRTDMNLLYFLIIWRLAPSGRNDLQQCEALIPNGIGSIVVSDILWKEARNKIFLVEMMMTLLLLGFPDIFVWSSVSSSYHKDEVDWSPHSFWYHCVNKLLKMDFFSSHFPNKIN